MNMQTRIKQRPPELAPELKVADKARVVLADGAIALAWTVDSAIGTGLRCRVLGEDGMTERTDFVIEAADIDRTTKPRLTALGDGGFRIAWVELGAAGPRIAAEEVHPK